MGKLIYTLPECSNPLTSRPSLTPFCRMMTKRAQGRKRFGRRNFKQRFFRLTTQSLCYSKAKGKRILCDIPLSEILTVKKVDERSFKMQNIFEVSLDFY